MENFINKLFLNMKYNNVCSFAKNPHGKDESVFEACFRLPVAMLPYHYNLGYQ